MHHSYTHSHLFRLRLLHGPVSGRSVCYGGTATRLYGDTLPNCTAAATLIKDLETLVESRS